MFDQAVTMNATQLLAGKNTPTARLQSAQHFKGGRNLFARRRHSEFYLVLNVFCNLVYTEIIH